jgi:hypothetical protein
MMITALALTSSNHAPTAEIAASLGDNSPLPRGLAIGEVDDDPIARLAHAVGQRGI